MLQRSNREIAQTLQPFARVSAAAFRAGIAAALDIEPKHVSVSIAARIPLEDAGGKRQLLQISADIALGASQ